MQTNFRLLRKDADHERFHFVVGEAGVEVLQLEELTDGDGTVDVDALGAEVGAALDGVEDAPSVLLGMIDDVVSTEGVVVSVDVKMPEVAGMSSATVRGAVRRGDLLLPGLLRCGHCGRKLHVHYSGKLGGYNC